MEGKVALLLYTPFSGTLNHLHEVIFSFRQLDV